MRLMYHAACKVELQPFKRSYSQKTFFNFLMRSFFAFRKKSLFKAGRTSIGCQKKKTKHFSLPGMSVWFNIVIGHLGRPYSTHTSPMPVLTGSVHANIPKKPCRAVFAVIRLELIEPGAATCVSNEARPRDRSDRGRFLRSGKKAFQAKNPLHSGSYERRVPKIKK